MRILSVAGFVISAYLAGSASPALATIPYPTTPTWQSTPNGYVSTGGGFADINRDGWPDMVVANGNDIERQHLTVYLNNGNGTFPANPSWQSADIDYHGHLSLGDVNNDDWIDCAVAVYLGPGGFGTKGKAKLYLNNAGTLAANPSWVSSETFYAFGCALGDMDGDGDLDLACACGDDYNDQTEPQRIFRNIGGTFEGTASWRSTDLAYALDVTWGDVDRDGDVEPIFCGSSAPVRYYRNDQTTGGSISTTTTWQNTDLPEFGNTATVGDWNGDGFPELAVADNNQLGGAGRFKVYANNSGALGTTPAWQSSNGGYGSNVSWADLDLDGDLDLATGRWFSQSRIYENTGGTLTTAPVWTSGTSSVIENIYFADVDRDGLRTDGRANLNGTGSRTFFAIGQVPVEGISEVRVNGTPTTSYAASLENGWVSISPPPPAGVGNVEIRFSYSVDLDMGMTNWDSSIGNYLFTNLRTTASAPDTDGPANPNSGNDLAAADLRAWPNPVTASTALRYRGPAGGDARLSIFDAAGREVARLHDGRIEGELRIWEWTPVSAEGRPLPAGAYFARIQTDSGSVVTRVTLLPR
ncbi:MAG: T9SS type A sorting domain-containing protein [Candidatus Eisenbacteria bacterium]